MYIGVRPTTNRNFRAGMNYKQILKGPGAAALAILIAASTADGIYYNSPEALAVAILLLGIFNIFLKPLLMIFSLPFIVLSLGLGILIINACLFLLAAAIVNGFYVESFWSALWGAFVLGVINIIASIYLDDPKNRKFTVNINRGGRFQSIDKDSRVSKISRQSKASTKDDDIIDV